MKAKCDLMFSQMRIPLNRYLKNSNLMLYQRYQNLLPNNDSLKHDKNCYIYCVSWNQKDARKIASAGGDGACMVHQTNGKLIQSFKHPAAVYGCDWNPNNENIVATACEDSLVRVFYVGSGTDQPLKILSGHSGKVFRVKWSPLKDGILCSTSDDCSVRVWHYAQGIAIRVLLGHTSYTRGLLWCPEHPNIVISGSWDSTIRVWDISDGACMDVIEDHGADVYGLACHSGRPFVFASTSRDSTVRLWSMLPLVSSLYIKILVSRPQNDIFSPSIIQASSEFNESFGLYGPQSKIVKEIISKSEAASNTLMWKAVSLLFCAPPGLSNLWDLLSVMNNEEVDFAHYKTGIVHRKHITKLTMAMALEKELANVSFFGSGVNSCGKSENIKRAAECHVLTGNLKKYCELKIQLGDWLEAIALAPGVSLTYWKEITQRWLKLMEHQSNELIAPLYIATNQVEELIKYYIKQNFLEKAHIISVAFSEDLMPKSIQTEDGVSAKNNEGVNFCEKIISSNIKRLAERCLLYGSPIKAACWHFSNDDIQNGLYCLLRGNELELAVSLCLNFKLCNQSFKMAVNYLAWKCVRKHEWELALDVLSLCPETENEKICICINSGLSLTERNELHKKVGLPPVEECDQEALTSNQNEDSILKVVQLYLLSNEKKKGLDIGLQYVKEKLEGINWNLENLWQLLRTMSCISSHLLQDIAFDRHRFELQVYSAYVGALVAIRQGFYPVVVPLFSTALTLMKRVHNANLPLTEDLVSSEMHAWISSRSSDLKNNSEKENIHKELMAKVMQDPPFGDVGVTFVSGSNLPRHSDHHRCYLQGTAIQGPVYFLDDCKSAISINDALMWAKVNFFSPLKTGLLINPF